MAKELEFYANMEQAFYCLIHYNRSDTMDQSLFNLGFSQLERTMLTAEIDFKKRKLKARKK